MKRQALIDYRGERSQASMAKAYGVSQQAWQLWEAGETKPRIETMKRLELDSGIPMERLFADVFNKKILFKPPEAATA